MAAATTRLAEYQLSREEAVDFAASGKWKALDLAERAVLQLRQQRLCMDFSAFHAAITDLLGRPVFTHEFADPDLLWEEHLGLRARPDFDEIIAKLPEHLRRNMIVVKQD